MDGIAVSEELTFGSMDNGRHICSIFRNTEEQFSPIAAFFANGLKSNQKCIYVYNNVMPSKVLTDLEILGIEVDSLMQKKQIEFFSKSESYLAGGTFNSGDMIKTTEKFVKDSLGQNYTGLRAVGDMSWTIDYGLDIAALIEYECNLNNFYPNFKISGICQYDENMFDKQVLIDIIRTHPNLIIYGKLYKNKYFYTPPEYIKNALKKFDIESYETMLSLIMNDN